MPGRAVLSVAGGGRGPGRCDVPQWLLIHSSQACRALASLCGPNTPGRAGPGLAPVLWAWTATGGLTRPCGLWCLGPALACAATSSSRCPGQGEAVQLLLSARQLCLITPAL